MSLYFVVSLQNRDRKIKHMSDLRKLEIKKRLIILIHLFLMTFLIKLLNGGNSLCLTVANYRRRRSLPNSIIISSLINQA